MSYYKFTPAMILAAAGAYSAPAIAAPVIVQNFNLAPGGNHVRPLTIGQTHTAQYTLRDTYFNDTVKGSFSFRGIEANGNSLFGPAVSTSMIPTSSDGFDSNTVKVDGFLGDLDADHRYLQLAFDVKGKSTFGVAAFGEDGTLKTISYNGVPEPATWMELIVGLGLTGAAMRRSRRSRQPAAIAA